MAAKENSKPGFETQPERRSAPRQEIKPSYSRNAFWNDYKGRRIYMYTFRMAKGFPPLFKPPGKLFDLCSEGRLLYLAPWEYETRKSDLTRSECVEMNEIAEAIAGEELVLRLKA